MAVSMLPSEKALGKEPACSLRLGRSPNPVFPCDPNASGETPPPRAACSLYQSFHHNGVLHVEISLYAISRERLPLVNRSASRQHLVPVRTSAGCGSDARPGTRTEVAARFVHTYVVNLNSCFKFVNKALKCLT